MPRYGLTFNDAWAARIDGALGKDGVEIEVRLKMAIKKAVGQAELDQFVEQRQKAHEEVLRARAKQIEDEINEDEG